MTRTAIALLALLTGCASAPQPLTITRTIYVPWAFPGALQTCAADPAPLPVPHIAATDPHAGSEVARYVLALRQHDNQALSAADDCRATLAAAVSAADQSQTTTK